MVQVRDPGRCKWLDELDFLDLEVAIFVQCDEIVPGIDSRDKTTRF
jgi:hypothetical protein